MGDIRVAKRLETASLRVPCDAVHRQMLPVRIFQLPEGSQDPTVIALGLLDRPERLWRIVQIGAEAKQSGPR